MTGPRILDAPNVRDRLEWLLRQAGSAVDTATHAGCDSRPDGQDGREARHQRAHIQYQLDEYRPAKG